ncbi:hypothetical protein [Cyclobacterium salsum]|uniref:hypothetical protein n=1 Tax=Cyclobacterium salsum TaxID=2666329 RepID=UPI001390EC39|nr:hypothetical protein [Cyclobacterium salsum]
MNLNVVNLSAAIACTLLFIACDGSQSGKDNLNEAEDEMEAITSDTKEEVNEVLSETEEVISKETAELKEEASNLKSKLNENQLEPADSAISEHISRLDEGIQNLELKSREFENAAQKRKEQIKTEFDKLVVEVETSLENLKEELQEG